MNKKLRRRHSRQNVSPPARLLMRAGLILSALMLSACLLLIVYQGPPAIHNRRVYALIAQLYRAPQSVLLVSSLGAVCLDGILKQ